MCPYQRSRPFETEYFLYRPSFILKPARLWSRKLYTRGGKVSTKGQQSDSRLSRRLIMSNESLPDISSTTFYGMSSHFAAPTEPNLDSPRQGCYGVPQAVVVSCCTTLGSSVVNVTSTNNTIGCPYNDQFHVSPFRFTGQPNNWTDCVQRGTENGIPFMFCSDPAPAKNGAVVSRGLGGGWVFTAAVGMLSVQVVKACV